MREHIFLWFQTHRRQLKSAVIVLILGIIYYIITQFTSFRIPCPFQAVTGFACAGCGISHFCIRLLHLDFIGAARENMALAALLPLWIAALAIRIIWNPKWFCKNSRAEKILLWGSIILLLLFGILRNLPHMEFLLPSYLRTEL